MTYQHPPRAILDADILYSRVLYELMGRMATAMRELDLVWSDQLIDEATRMHASWINSAAEDGL